MDQQFVILAINDQGTILSAKVAPNRIEAGPLVKESQKIPTAETVAVIPAEVWFA